VILLISGGMVYRSELHSSDWSCRRWRRLPFHDAIWHRLLLVAASFCYAADLVRHSSTHAAVLIVSIKTALDGGNLPAVLVILQPAGHLGKVDFWVRLAFRSSPERRTAFRKY
jgi:hypothetical protein